MGRTARVVLAPKSSHASRAIDVAAIGPSGHHIDGHPAVVGCRSRTASSHTAAKDNTCANIKAGASSQGTSDVLFATSTSGCAWSSRHCDHPPPFRKRGGVPREGILAARGPVAPGNVPRLRKTASRRPSARLETETATRGRWAASSTQPGAAPGRARCSLRRPYRALPSRRWRYTIGMSDELRSVCGHLRFSV